VGGALFFVFLFKCHSLYAHYGISNVKIFNKPQQTQIHDFTIGFVLKNAKNLSTTASICNTNSNLFFTKYIIPHLRKLSMLYPEWELG
jgi:hypothetical protein